MVNLQSPVRVDVESESMLSRLMSLSRRDWIAPGRAARTTLLACCVRTRTNKPSVQRNLWLNWHHVIWEQDVCFNDHDVIWERDPAFRREYQLKSSLRSKIQIPIMVCNAKPKPNPNRPGNLPQLAGNSATSPKLNYHNFRNPPN